MLAGYDPAEMDASASAGPGGELPDVALARSVLDSQNTMLAEKFEVSFRPATLCLWGGIAFDAVPGPVDRTATSHSPAIRPTVPCQAR